MAPTTETKSFETSMKKLLTRWEKKVKAPLAAIEKLDKEIKKLEAKKPLSPEEEKLKAKCIAARTKFVKQVEKANLELRVEVMIITPPPKAQKNDLLKLIKPLIKKFKDGLPLGKGWTLTPDIDVDLKKRKIKKFELKLKWTF